MLFLLVVYFIIKYEMGGYLRKWFGDGAELNSCRLGSQTSAWFEWSKVMEKVVKCNKQICLYTNAMEGKRI